MTGLIGNSLHIKWEELDCHDGSPYPSMFIMDGRVIELVVMFERIRNIWNLPITINSAYRTIEYNRKVGGATNSQHILGKALDLQPPIGVHMSRFYDTIKMSHKFLGIKGLGKYPTFVHCDIRDSDELVTWVG